MLIHIACNDLIVYILHCFSVRKWHFLYSISVTVNLAIFKMLRFLNHASRYWPYLIYRYSTTYTTNIFKNVFSEYSYYWCFVELLVRFVLQCFLQLSTSSQTFVRISLYPVAMCSLSSFLLCYQVKEWMIVLPIKTFKRIVTMCMYVSQALKTSLMHRNILIISSMV